MEFHPAYSVILRVPCDLAPVWLKRVASFAKPVFPTTWWHRHAPTGQSAAAPEPGGHHQAVAVVAVYVLALAFAQARNQCATPRRLMRRRAGYRQRPNVPGARSHSGDSASGARSDPGLALVWPLRAALCRSGRSLGLMCRAAPRPSALAGTATLSGAYSLTLQSLTLFDSQHKMGFGWCMRFERPSHEISPTFLLSIGFKNSDC